MIKKRERLVLSLGLAFGVVFLGYSLAAKPLLEEQKRVENQIKTKTALLEKYQMVLSRRQSLEEESERLEKRLAKLENNLLRGDKPPLAAAELQKILKAAAQQADVNITSERILDPVVKGHYLEIPVEIKVKCSVTKFTKLLFAIENSPQRLSIKELNLRADHKINPKKVNAVLVVVGLIVNPDTV